MNLVTNKPTSSALPMLSLGGSSSNNFQMVLFGRRKLKSGSEMSQNAKTVVIDTPTLSAHLAARSMDPDVKVCVFRYGAFVSEVLCRHSQICGRFVVRNHSATDRLSRERCSSDGCRRTRGRRWMTFMLALNMAARDDSCDGGRLRARCLQPARVTLGSAWRLLPSQGRLCDRRHT